MLMDLLPLEVKHVTLETDMLKQFEDKQYMKTLLEKMVTINEDGEFQMPVFDERDLSIPIFKGSQQRRVLPFGFKVIDYETEYSPLGRAIVTVSACVINKLSRDGRHPDKTMICEHKVYFVFIESTRKWLWVDMGNENHQNTQTYRQREKDEIELVEQFRQDYFDYYKRLSIMLNTETSFVSVSRIQKYLELFAEYTMTMKKGLAAYRFFDSISPVEYKYLEKYATYLLDKCNEVWENFNFIKGDAESGLTDYEKEKLAPIKEAAEEVRKFFTPRTEKNPDKTKRYGYCPTFHYQNELNRIMIPNVAEVERRAAFNSPNLHWSEDKEKEFIRDFISYHFKKHDSKESEPEPETKEYIPGVLGERYQINKELLNEWKSISYDEVKKKFIKIGQENGIRPNDYLNDLKELKSVLNSTF
ncbi:hypothetical protein [Bacillus thuringiensis]|uniref:Uncharacterized protein n=1 Tax=Bacillus thuringiensis TaxID=1428 RepID=A0A9X6WKG6_BACTU|nr:hypothetical protein [Bacillus thuringiensis]PFJ36442.1 hypothetical protein COJ15_22785 [Bacillus thuringiensis]